MNKKDVFELKNRFKKTGCTFTKMCGCYVNAAKETLVNFNETFLNLEEDEFYKYLEIAKKTLSGTVGNNLIELNFPLEEEDQGGKQQFLMGLRESKLKNEGLLETFYQLIIDSYDYAGNYLILVFHDAYDVITKTSDNSKLDESEEVYEYLLCAICPVTLTKPGLGYLEDKNKIGPRNRDWVVGVPETGFIFPAFTERSTDIHSAMFYTKNASEPHNELVELTLGCPPKATATEQKNTFHTIIKNAINDSEKTTIVIGEIQESLNQIVEEQAQISKDSEEPVILTAESVLDVLTESALPRDIAEKIQTSYSEVFCEEPPVVEHLLDKKILAENEKNKTNKALVEQINILQERLKETAVSAETADKQNMQELNTDDGYDIMLQVKDEKMDQIKAQMLDGRKCIIIPLEENEHVTINGMTDLY
ncbi:uncharacterized protein DUF4317 [Lachnotalea glycerini]|uniref:DUF4317 domain-containing protein n=1 Tax=Lachnotalea glycerini TaxID=1763509 RepID=A0A255I507_9FIRM|nr:DUF4317 domain-containing protein [Lachnotalea glycerini]PXV95682.1 uncharacterized protein DUF4317 [Lachnotalea glycerini]RDY33270.1 DUF4317 domain-containing protein [Lachnotalea glycerini]